MLVKSKLTSAYEDPIVETSTFADVPKRVDTVGSAPSACISIHTLPVGEPRFKSEGVNLLIGPARATVND